MSGEDIRFIIGAVLTLCGLCCSVISVVGVFRFRFALNRMHASAMNDTLGILLMLGGLIVMCGFSWHSLKLALVIIFFWIAAPVSGHLISRLQVLLEDKPVTHYEDLTSRDYPDAYKNGDSSKGDDDN